MREGLGPARLQSASVNIREAGFAAGTSLEDGLRKTIAWTAPQEASLST